MSDFDTKMQELETKRKRSNRGIISIIVIGLMVFAGLYLNSLRVEGLKQEQAREDGELLMEQQTKLVVEDSLRKELARVQGKLEKIKIAATDNNDLADELDKLDIELDRKNVIPVHYYKRKKDKDVVYDVLKSIPNVNFELQLVEVYGDGGEHSVNTLYVGEDVDSKAVAILQRTLQSKGMKLNQEPFVSIRGFEWKKKAIEIGYERDPSIPNKNAKTYVRLYCYAPNEIVKKKIEGKLGAKGYQVRVFPDWEKKPSFFSDKTTLLYYDKSKLQEAQLMSRWLTKLTGVSFSTKMGAGLGVSAEDRKNLFIIHYNGRSM